VDGPMVLLSDESKVGGGGGGGGETRLGISVRGCVTSV
jgi:hypothetical protein